MNSGLHYYPFSFPEHEYQQFLRHKEVTGKSVLCQMREAVSFYLEHRDKAVPCGWSFSGQPVSGVVFILKMVVN